MSVFDEIKKLQKMLDDAGIHSVLDGSEYIKHLKVQIGQNFHISVIQYKFENNISTTKVNSTNCYNTKINQTAEGVFELIKGELNK